MTQKVLKVGTSAAVTIPKGSLRDLGLKVGDVIAVQIDRKHRRMTIERAPQEFSKKADEEVIAWTKKFIERYRPALEALAKK